MEDKILIPRPGCDVTPEAFFDEWLPAALDEYGALIASHAGELAFKLTVVVDGAAWTVTIADGEAGVESGEADDADLWLVLSEPCFVSAVCGRHDDLLPGPEWLKKDGEPAPPERIGAEVRKGAGLAWKINGTLGFTAPGEEAFEAVVGLGKKPEGVPATRVTIDQEDLRRIAAGDLGMIMAFMSGKVKVTGAMDLILGLAPFVS